jgi:hypothetical protein
MISNWEVEELACYICGKSEDEIDEIINDGSINEILYEKYEIDFEQFYKIVDDLIKFTLPIKTELANIKVRGFVKDDNFIVKEEIK